MTKLTVKQDKFVLAYLETGNASEAFRRAFDTTRMLDRTVTNNAYKLLQRDIIKQAIAERRQETYAVSAIDRAGVLSLLTEIATADPNELMQIQVRNCRHCWGVKHQKQWKNADEFAIALAVSIDGSANDLRAWERDVALGSKLPAPEPRPLPSDEGGYGFDVMAAPNLECPVCLGEGHVVPVVKDTRKLKGAAKRLYAGFKQTKEGIEIKTQDQAQARAILAKEYGIGKEAPAVAVQVNNQTNIQAENVTIATDAQEASRQYQELMKGG